MVPPQISRRECLRRFANHAAWLAAPSLLTGLSGCVDQARPLAHDRLLQKVWGQHGLDHGRFHKPRAMAIDAKDQIYIVDMTGRIQVFDPDGNFLRQWETPTIAQGKPTGLAISNDGCLMVADTHYYRVLFYSTEGEQDPTRTIGGVNGQGPGQFGFVTDVCEDRDGRYFIAEYGEFDRIQAFTPDGQFLYQFGKHGTEPGEFNRPQTLLIAPDGYLWVVDAHNHRLQIFECDDTRARLVEIIGQHGKEPGAFDYPYGLCLGKDEFLYVVERGGHRIQKLRRNGEFVAQWGQPGTEIGQLNCPWAVVQDSQKRLHILDTQNHRIQRIAFI